MKSNKLRHIFFASLFTLSISSTLYLNLHVEQSDTSYAEMTSVSSEPSDELMADIDAFKTLLRSVAKQIKFH